MEIGFPLCRSHQYEGCIFWLPKKDEIDENLLWDVDIEEGCFDHPVVVLSTDEQKAAVLIVRFMPKDFKYAS